LSSSSGETAFLYSAGTMKNLGVLVGYADSSGTAINAGGQVVGMAMSSNGASQTAFLYSTGTITNLGALPGYPMSVASSINAGGQVVGTCSDGSGNYAAF